MRSTDFATSPRSRASLRNRLPCALDGDPSIVRAMVDPVNAGDNMRLFGKAVCRGIFGDPGRSCVRLLPPGTFPVSLRLSHRAKDKE